ncbi:transposase zinc-binding domain-containing protein [Mesorhizobium caraganae]|nr:transposase zinc-binding domain-containing protein [Mesorhizobium caraganae]
MTAIELCRTAELGGHVEGVLHAGIRVAYISCRNRHCPKCQGKGCREWLAARQTELLPVPYFHVVFTLPAAIAFQNKAAATRFCSRRSPRRCARSLPIPNISAPRSHTSRCTTSPPPLHRPCGGISLDGKRWISCRPGFFLPVRVLSRLFRRLFLE